MIDKQCYPNRQYPMDREITPGPCAKLVENNTLGSELASVHDELNTLDQVLGSFIERLNPLIEPAKLFDAPKLQERDDFPQALASARSAGNRIIIIRSRIESIHNALAL